MDMDAPSETAPARSTRQAQAAANDARILAAARAVFLSNPNAPISAIAERAGVGIAALYRRYPSKEELIKQIYLENLELLFAEVRAALADDGDPWEVFCRFYHRGLDVGGGSTTLRFPGAFAFTGELGSRSRELDNALQELMVRTQMAGALRPDIGMGDLQWTWVSAQAIQVRDERRTSELRHRYLALLLDGLRASAATPLPGPPPNGMEYEEYWDLRRAGSVQPGTRTPAAP
jgi:AcrR family transcriptional regulator